MSNRADISLKAGQKVAQTFGNLAVGDVISSVGSFTSAIAKGASDPSTVDVLNLALQALGTVAATCPFLVPVQLILRDIGTAMQVCILQALEWYILSAVAIICVIVAAFTRVHCSIERLPSAF